MQLPFLAFQPCGSQAVLIVLPQHIELQRGRIERNHTRYALDPVCGKDRRRLRVKEQTIDMRMFRHVCQGITRTISGTYRPVTPVNR